MDPFPYIRRGPGASRGTIFSQIIRSIIYPANQFTISNHIISQSKSWLLKLLPSHSDRWPMVVAAALPHAVVRACQQWPFLPWWPLNQEARKLTSSMQMADHNLHAMAGAAELPHGENARPKVGEERGGGVDLLHPRLHLHQWTGGDERWSAM